MFFFAIWWLTLSMPHVRGCLKTSSHDNCVLSDPFCTVNSEKEKKNLQSFNMRAPPPTFLLTSSHLLLESGGLGGDEHLDQSNHSGLVSSENCRRAQTASRVDLRLGEPLALTFAKLASKSFAKNAAKTSRKFLEI